MARLSSQKNLHIALFPFMSKGHTIPLLHLAKLIHQHRRHATFTIFTTPANELFISTSLSTLSPSIFTIISLPFGALKGDKNTSTISIIPCGVESTDQLPSMSLFHSFVYATESLKPSFETALQDIQNGGNPITFLVCDMFLFWTHDVTSKFNIPRLYFSGMGIYASTIMSVVSMNKLFEGIESMDEAVKVPGFHGITVTMNDFDDPFNGSKVDEIVHDFLLKCAYACSTGHGFVVNSFEELELEFLRHLNSFSHQKNWCVGPLCLVEKPEIDGSSHTQTETPIWMNWLNKRKEGGKPVLYVAFGTQAEITKEQLKEMALGLERSDVDFLWALRIKPAQEETLKGFVERVKERGIIVREWVEQRAIIEHESVRGFLSHCGWNSVIESICGGVPILAWPMMADQHVNTKLVVEEIKVGLRVETCNGSVRGFVKWEGLSKMVKELMSGELGKVVRENVGEYSLAAKKAVLEGGSSCRNLHTLLNELGNDMK